MRGPEASIRQQALAMVVAMVAVLRLVVVAAHGRQRPVLVQGALTEREHAARTLRLAMVVAAVAILLRVVATANDRLRLGTVRGAPTARALRQQLARAVAMVVV